MSASCAYSRRKLLPRRSDNPAVEFRGIHNKRMDLEKTHGMIVRDWQWQLDWWSLDVLDSGGCKLENKLRHSSTLLDSPA